MSVVQNASPSLDRADLRAELEEARARTLALIEPVAPADLERVHSPLMSPLAWDLGHIAAFEDLWLCQRAGGLEPLRPELALVYDAAETPRPRRSELPFLRTADAFDYMAHVRERALRVLEDVDLAPEADRLNAGGFVWQMLIQHEQQHNETMLQTLQIAEQGVYAPQRRALPPAPADPVSGMASFGAATVAIGIEPAGFAYDNERPLHEVEVDAFRIDRTPVTCGDYRQFVADAGYRRPELWSGAGWAWREREQVELPLYWLDAERSRSFEHEEPIDPASPVIHVSCHEAEAFARWAGKRLPTEAEWEAAASWDGDRASKRRYPWGDDPGWQERANLDQLALGPAPAGSMPAGASPCGALGMLGDVWEWTASNFGPYPGFSAFPYPEYSEVFFGEGYRVLRGGSWATRPQVIRASFRNWDFPERRQIFAGFRCAEDA